MIGHAGARILVWQSALARARLPDAHDIAYTRVAGLDCAVQPVASLHQEDEAGVGLALLTQGYGEPLAREPKLRSCKGGLLRHVYRRSRSDMLYGHALIERTRLVDDRSVLRITDGRPDGKRSGDEGVN